MTPAAPAWRRWLRGALALPPAYAGMLVLLALAAVLRPQLLSAMLLPLIARQAAPLGLAVIGQSLVMRARSIDLSSGGVIVAVSYLLTSGYFQVSDAVAMVLCVALGLVVGVGQRCADRAGPGLVDDRHAGGVDDPHRHRGGAVAVPGAR